MKIRNASLISTRKALFPSRFGGAERPGVGAASFPIYSVQSRCLRRRGELFSRRWKLPSGEYLIRAEKRKVHATGVEKVSLHKEETEVVFTPCAVNAIGGEERIG
jgi:hypothetical protein